MKMNNQSSDCELETLSGPRIVKKMGMAARARSRWLFFGAGMALLAGVLSGCGSTQTTGASSSSGSGTTTSTSSDNPDATGNWQFNLAPNTGSKASFPVLSGYIKDNVSDTGSTKYTQAEMTETTTTTCFLGTIPIFLTGTTIGNAMDFNTLAINGQYIATTGTLDSTSSTMTGTYAVSQGCAAGTAGTYTAARYTALTGTYTGTTGGTAPAKITLVITQNATGNGAGTFLVSGTATVTGSSCFSSGSVTSQNPDSYVTGSAANLVFADSTSGSDADLTLVGSFNVTATTLTLTSAAVSNGATGCGTLGNGIAILTKS